MPEREEPIYRDLLHAVIGEFTEVFGGCTMMAAAGSFSSEAGATVAEGIQVVYTDTGFDFQNNLQTLSEYADKLRENVFRALDEEDILVAVLPVYHSV